MKGRRTACLGVSGGRREEKRRREEGGKRRREEVVWGVWVVKDGWVGVEAEEVPDSR